MACDPEDETAALVDLNFKQVLREEQELIRERRSQRAPEATAEKRPRFAVAFSGGGIRAAAFQSGVLWRLAESGRLKDVDYLSAVSGGAYIAAAFASHTVAENPPEKASEVDSWYLKVVAKTLCRMQRNAGGFVRDPAQESPPGAGWLPRWLDAPVLTLAVMMTLAVNPVELLFLYLVPITEVTQLFFGAGLRKAYCNPHGEAVWSILREWSLFGYLFHLAWQSMLLTFLLWVLSKTSSLQLGEHREPKKGNRTSYLMIQASLAFVSRFTVALVMFLALLLSVPAVQHFSYPPELIHAQTGQPLHAFCQRYVLLKGQSISNPAMATNMGCANYFRGKAWFNDKYIRSYYEANASQTDVVSLRRKHGSRASLTRFDGFGGHALPKNTTNSSSDVVVAGRPVMSMIFSLLMLFLVIAGFLVPFFPELFLGVLTMAGPTLVFGLIVTFVQYRTYGPLTGQPLFWSLVSYDYPTWESFVKICLVANLLLAFFFNDFRRVWHWFYDRSLRLNFFDQSRDWRFVDMKSHPYCPFVLFTGTVSDYKQPGDKEGVSEISFSGLHTGGMTTGYVRTPTYQRLATCTALSGAGCLDAISLSMVNHLKFRFWLEMLNLSWGDFILFTRRGSKVAQACREWVGETFERSTTWIVYRLPACTCWFLAVLLFWLGLRYARRSGDGDCEEAKHLVTFGVLVVCSLFGLSFFAFLAPLEFLMFNPIIRQMQQATRYIFQSNRPPGMLYVTDGGVRDCTSILQLMRRRCETILLVLAVSDPDDELGVLRVAMEAAVEDRTGTFYDPEDPKRDVRIALEEFQLNKDQAYLHLGIRYGWGQKSEGNGDLYVVKNRLPPSLQGAAVRPLLTEEEIRREGVSKDFGPFKEAWEGLRAAELGGLGCCDCCHRKGCNCGAKFPHLTGANYLYLTPMLFSSLSRLGFEVSEKVIETIAK